MAILNRDWNAYRAQVVGALTDFGKLGPRPHN